MKVLYTGPLRRGSMTESRRLELLELGHEVISVDQSRHVDRRRYIDRKLHQHLLVGPGIGAYNRELLQTAARTQPDLIYIDQAHYLWPQTVRALQKTTGRMVHYTSEHFGFRRYLFRHFHKTIPLYDVHVHTYAFSKQWLELRGARRVVLSEFGYDPRIHRPPELTEEDRRKYGSDVIFIGHHEPSTEKMILALQQAGIDVKIYGSGWKRRSRHIRGGKQIRPASLEEYVKLIACAKVCLCFLSKWNNNTLHSAGRTFEIPAIGSFLLAERTPDHLRYYVEGKEAEFFGSSKELVDKVRYYLAHDDQRRAIAEAGHLRCLTSGYSHRERMKQILELIN